MVGIQKLGKKELGTPQNTRKHLWDITASRVSSIHGYASYRKTNLSFFGVCRGQGETEEHDGLQQSEF